MTPQRFKNTTPRKRTNSASSSSSQGTITSPIKPRSTSITPVVSPNVVLKSPRKSPEKIDEKVTPVECEFEAPIGSRNLRANRRHRPPLVSEKLSIKPKEVKRRDVKATPVIQENEASISDEAQAKIKIQEEIHRAISFNESESEKSDNKPIYVQIIIPYFKSPSDFRIRVSNHHSYEFLR